MFGLRNGKRWQTVYSLFIEDPGKVVDQKRSRKLADPLKHYVRVHTSHLLYSIHLLNFDLRVV